MNTKVDFSRMHGQMVYVKPVAVDELPQEVQDQADGLETLFAVHNSDGQQLALVADRKLAFVLARQHDMVPVTLH